MREFRKKTRSINTPLYLKTSNINCTLHSRWHNRQTSYQVFAYKINELHSVKSYLSLSTVISLHAVIKQAWVLASLSSYCICLATLSLAASISHGFVVFLWACRCMNDMVSACLGVSMCGLIHTMQHFDTFAADVMLFSCCCHINVALSGMKLLPLYCHTLLPHDYIHTYIRALIYRHSHICT